MATDEDNQNEEALAGSQMRFLELLDALRDVATAELSKGPGIASNAWRQLHNVASDLLGDDQLASAVQVPGRPALVIPPARGGATQVPHRPPMGVPPPPRKPIPIGGDGDIRKRADVAAELERVKKGGK